MPLAALLRKPTEQWGDATVVKEYLSVDVFAAQLTSIDAAPSADATAIAGPSLRGSLKLVLARLSVGSQNTAVPAETPAFGGSTRSGSSRSAKVAPSDVSFGPLGMLMFLLLALQIWA